MLARYLQLYRHEHNFTNKTEELDMCNPYDNNPFRTDDRRDFTNEYDANRALANPTDKDFDERNYTDGAWWLEREADRREKEEK